MKKILFALGWLWSMQFIVCSRSPAPLFKDRALKNTFKDEHEFQHFFDQAVIDWKLLAQQEQAFFKTISACCKIAEICSVNLPHRTTAVPYQEAKLKTLEKELQRLIPHAISLKQTIPKHIDCLQIDQTNLLIRSRVIKQHLIIKHLPVTDGRAHHPVSELVLEYDDNSLPKRDKYEFALQRLTDAVEKMESLVENR